MQRVLIEIVGFLVPIVEACGALIIVLEVSRTIVQYVGAFFGLLPAHTTGLRLRLGRAMVMALEFQVAADILKTALSPSWNDILLLAALIGLRTVLNYLLEYELRLLRSKAEDSNDGDLLADHFDRAIGKRRS